MKFPQPHFDPRNDEVESKKLLLVFYQENINAKA